MDSVLGQITSGLLVAIISFATGFLANSVVRGLDRRDAEHASRVDEACKLVDNIAEKSRKYWSEKSGQQLKELKIEIISLDYRLGSVFDLLKKIDVSYSDIADKWHNKFSGIVTGGDFQVANRDVDLRRLRQADTEATCLVVRVRHVRRAILWRWFQ
ncbi:MAG: hypothetical protein ACR2RE_16735 [Geminicoccaceae bacterium]